MNITRKFIAASAIVLLSPVMAFAADSGAGAPGTAQPTLEQRIANASKPSDHLWLADYYDGQAAQARSIVEQHRKMSEGYGVWGAGRGNASASMSSHCRNLAEQSQKSADTYAAMAKLHRDLAGTAK